MSKTNKSAIFVGGMILGSAIGTVAGMIIAPRSGKETRRILRKSADALPELAEDLATTTQTQVVKLSNSALRNWDDTLTRLKDALAAGIEASQTEARKINQVEQVDPETNSHNVHPSKL